MSETTHDTVELVDPNGTTTGLAGKLEAHVAPGLLHRAVSVILFDEGLTLLQRRGPHLYHFANRWSNTCCTHPRPGESPLGAARRRLMEEMGIRADVTPVGTLRYEAEDAVSGLVEREYDHIFVGSFAGTPRPDDRVVSGWRWVDIPTLHEELAALPQEYTPWLAGVLEVATQSPEPEGR